MLQTEYGDRDSPDPVIDHAFKAAEIWRLHVSAKWQFNGNIKYMDAHRGSVRYTPPAEKRGSFRLGNISHCCYKKVMKYSFMCALRDIGFNAVIVIYMTKVCVCDVVLLLPLLGFVTVTLTPRFSSADSAFYV